ncbi:AAA family ATPase [Solitalea sp. MAHUQ-68]|uniref:AAA family ATPase n=1 Tax=Solitalea agri TaxID=2953739 RepID=A0A9X2F3U6_9SPHI|nr:SbcC/MukB-like Walker B domain-containing protein [Solitalea agri]MCO4293730.1 AAA family ATPase [Solitalea agri]
MIPVKLIIKGLYSYHDEEEQVIDFARLTESHLFGIFGGVGSGKSSILDAITFAIYGSVERLSEKGDNRYFNMMNLKSSSLLIDFEFYDPIGTHYRIVVSGKRGKKHEDVKAYTRIVYELINNEWIAQDISLGDDLIGLSYDNFRRTIIIPQGKFQEFLELSTTDRTRMLKDIFSLEKFEFSDKINRLISQNNNDKAGLEGEMKQFESLDSANLEVMNTEIQSLKEQLVVLKKQIEEKETEQKALIDLKKLLDELEQSKQSLSLHQQQEDSIAELQKKLELYRYAVEKFKSILDRKKEKQQDLVQKQNRINLLENDQIKLDGQLREKNEQLNLLLPEFEKIGVYKELAADYKIAIDLISLQKQIVEIEKSIKKGESFVQQQSENYQNHKLTADKLKAEISQKRKLLPDWSLLNKMVTWFNQKTILLRDVTTAKTELEQVLQEQQQHLKTIATCIAEPIKHEFQSATDHLKLKQKAEELTQAYIKQEADLLTLQQNILVKSKLGEFARQLHAGSPCPLCGSIEHPSILNTEDVNAHITEIVDRLDKLKKLKESCAISLTALTKWELIYGRIEENILKLQNRVSEAETLLTQWLSNFAFEGFTTNDEKKVKALSSSAEVQNKELNDLEAQREKLDDEVSKADSNLNKAREKINTYQQQQAALLARSSEKKIQLKQLKADQITQSETELNTLANQFETKVKTVEAEVESLKLVLQQLEQQKASYSGQLAAFKQEFAVSEQQLLGIENELKTAIESSTFNGLEEIESILNKALDIGLAQAQISAYNEKKASLLSLIQRLEQQTESRAFNSEAYETLLQDLQLLKTQHQDKNDHLVRISALLNQYFKDLKRKEELQEKLNQLQKRGDNLSVLSGLFRSSGFVNYVSSIYMQQLCKAANDRFHKLTRQQLQLEVDEQNNFHVRDMLNDGRMRLVKTLSGGQKFQASLCLALALAESVQHFNKSEQSFFFLDEGFGSLDKDSLQVVFEALKSLRKENRIVGLISHVEELQQEIDTHVRIVNDPDKGSRIFASWE